MSVFVLCLSGCSESNEPMRGVTLESIEDFPASYEVIADSEETLTVRVVLDAERDLSGSITRKFEVLNVT